MSPLPKPEPQTVSSIYRALEARYQAFESVGLSISSLGTECDRALWLEFRWAVPRETPDGQRLRLFETGHREEARLLDELRLIGCHVSAEDPETGRQWSVQALGGHLRGRLDGAAIGIPEAPKTWHVVECKTLSAKRFREIVKDGVAKARPGHYAQCQLYMHLTGMKRALYLAVCRDDDALYAERIRHDGEWCTRALDRAERIIRAPEPPAKLHENPEHKGAFQCRMCPALAVCHQGAWARSHCRTCLHSSPVEGGWYCGRWDKALSVDEQRAGCPEHLFVPVLVPGEQVDVHETKHETLIEYRLRDGSTWVDGRSAA